MNRGGGGVLSMVAKIPKVRGIKNHICGIRNSEESSEGQLKFKKSSNINPTKKNILFFQ